VVLTGVDLTSWGVDLIGAPTLGHLVGRILEEVPGLRRLRLSSIDAAEIDADLMAVLASEARLMPHLHLSLQSGDDLILKRMKRRHLRADILALTAAVRAVRPEVAFGADFIAGFPTESEAAFENARMLAKVEGIPGGISTGANLAASIEIAKRPDMAGKTIVTFAPSSAERYFSSDLFVEPAVKPVA